MKFVTYEFRNVDREGNRETRIDVYDFNQLALRKNFAPGDLSPGLHNVSTNLWSDLFAGYITSSLTYPVRSFRTYDQAFSAILCAEDNIIFVKVRLENVTFAFENN